MDACNFQINMEFPVGSRVSALLWSIELKLQHMLNLIANVGDAAEQREKIILIQQLDPTIDTFHKEQEDHVFQIIVCLQKKTRESNNSSKSRFPQ